VPPEQATITLCRMNGMTVGSQDVLASPVLGRSV
jgi:hypothetical protein